MSTDPFTNLDPDQQVKVLPRHLAGPGTVNLRTVWPFPEDWSVHQSGDGAAFATSPCLRLWTGLLPDPDGRGKGKWTVTANRVPFGPAAWQITFDATPVAAARLPHRTARLLRLGPRRSARPAVRGRRPAAGGCTLLLADGWSHQVKTDGTQYFRAPEALGVVQHRYTVTSSDSPIWTAWGGYPSEPYWRARFSYGTPTNLVAAFTASLVCTEPVSRAVKDNPFHTRRHLYLAATTPPPKTPPSAPVPAPPALPGPSRAR